MRRKNNKRRTTPADVLADLQRRCADLAPREGRQTAQSPEESAPEDAPAPHD